VTLPAISPASALVYAGGARVTALAFERSHELAEDSVHETMGPSLQRNAHFTRIYREL
jgi:hypothetical protein